MNRTTTLGDLVRQRRMELGLSQEDVAEKVGRSQRWVSHIETGKAVGGMKTDLLYRLADALGMDPDALAVAGGITRTRQAARARRMLADMDGHDRDRLAEIHGRLDPLLLELDARQVERVIEFVQDRVEMMREAAAIRQAADPGRFGTDPQSPPADSGAGSPPRQAPERAGSDGDRSSSAGCR